MRRRRRGSSPVLLPLLLLFSLLLCCAPSPPATLASSPDTVEASAEEAGIGAGESPEKENEEDGGGPKNADQLGIPRCESNFDCVNDGLCRKDRDGYGRCICPASCPSHIPIQCSQLSLGRGRIRLHDPSSAACLAMSAQYTSRFDVNEPTCHMGKCACPPMFDPVSPPRNFSVSSKLLPVKCDKRELQVLGLALPSTSVFRGADVTLLCCINMDPRGIVDVHGVEFVQNTTIVREPTSSPFVEKLTDYDHISSPWCWVLKVMNVQLTDAGQYMCVVRQIETGAPVTHTIDVQVKERRIGAILHPMRRHFLPRAKKGNTVLVPIQPMAPLNKAPRSIQEFNIVPNATSAQVAWSKLDNDTALAIDLRLMRRTDRNGQEVWSAKNASSSLTITDLRPATPYTMFITVVDGHSEPFKFSQHFQTGDARPYAPKLEDIRVQNWKSGLVCDVEWRSPAVPNGRITKYFVRVAGALRSAVAAAKDGTLTPEHYPLAIDEKCANFDSSESTDSGINPVDFLGDFFSCKYGPLKPNRNYSVSIWAENTAARSTPAHFTRQCVTDFAEPDSVDVPQSVTSVNVSTFALRFDKKPDETNGPISCFYVAVVPLLPNVSLEAMPESAVLVMDTAANAYANNLHQSAAEQKRYFAYIAEAYTSLPTETIIGDGEIAAGQDACAGMYLNRFAAEDSPLRTGLKYTGFLVVRVDKIDSPAAAAAAAPLSPPARLTPPAHKHTQRWRAFSDASRNPQLRPRPHRQLQPSGPAYGFSPYFKPVLLQVTDGSSALVTFLTILGSLLLFVIAAGTLAAYLAHRRGLMSAWCPLAKADGVGTNGSGGGSGANGFHSSTGHRSLPCPEAHGPVAADDLLHEFRDRHRNSDYMFTAEFESLPNYADRLPCLASKTQRNSAKNRYKDILAFDETRVKLKRQNGVESSDYINANWIKSYDGEKKFIASQAPLDATVVDFWRMIWEFDVRIVVMLSNLVERQRSQSFKYWPDEDPISIGDMTIATVEADYLADHAIRQFDVACHEDGVIPNGFNRSSPELIGSINSEYANVPPVHPPRASNASLAETDFGGNSNVRRIAHFHFTAWPDYKAPECATGLLRFLHKLRAEDDFREHPVLVHCSAGVGRTGTFVAIDSLIDQLADRESVDVYGFVSEMRKQRNLMVQTTEQYVFIYRALAEHHLYGQTDMAAADFPRHYRQLARARNSREPTSAMREEFERLSLTLDNPASRKFGDQNPAKNRFPAAVPFDKNRVILSPIIGHADTQYINASNVKGYFYPYILAQDPLGPDTVFDFWRMIADQAVTTVVMLTLEDEFKPAEKYWPSGGEKACEFKQDLNLVHVHIVIEETHPTYRLRKLTYTTSSDSTLRSVWQFSLFHWPVGAARPASTESLLLLIGLVLERQSSNPDTGPIVLHSRNGSSEAGVFCAVSLLVERLKAEERVDVFQTVHGIQAQRPLTFTKIEEYEFCYDAVAESLRPHR